MCSNAPKGQGTKHVENTAPCPYNPATTATAKDRRVRHLHSAHRSPSNQHVLFFIILFHSVGESNSCLSGSSLNSSVRSISHGFCGFSWLHTECLWLFPSYWWIYRFYDWHWHHANESYPIPQSLSATSFTNSLTYSTSPARQPKTHVRVGRDVEVRLSVSLILSVKYKFIVFAAWNIFSQIQRLAWTWTKTQNSDYRSWGFE